MTYPYHEDPRLPVPLPPAPANYPAPVSYPAQANYPAPVSYPAPANYPAPTSYLAPVSYPVAVNYPVSPYAPMPVMRPPRSAGAAVALELVPGLFGVFGVGTIYAGRTGAGIALMVSFWLLFWINAVLCLIVVGWVTMPLTWLAYFIAGSLTAARSVEKYNAGH